jgi:hypothetical protein
MYKELLPPFHQEEAQELYEKSCAILDVMQKEVDASNNTIRGKYNDYYTIPGEFVRLVIEEFGFGYITDILSFSEDEIRDFLSYLPVIHALKGHKEGLVLVMDLLGITYTITEWWEEVPKGEPDTFSMTLDLDEGRVKPDTAENIIRFTQKYVYPILAKFILLKHANLFELMMGMGGILKNTINPGIQGKIWLRSRLGGVGIYTSKGVMTTYKDNTMRYAIGLAGADKLWTEGNFMLPEQTVRA